MRYKLACVFRYAYAKWSKNHLFYVTFSRFFHFPAKLAVGAGGCCNIKCSSNQQVHDAKNPGRFGSIVKKLEFTTVHSIYEGVKEYASGIFFATNTLFDR